MSFDDRKEKERRECLQQINGTFARWTDEHEDLKRAIRKQQPPGTPLPDWLQRPWWRR